jgi:hypothetical protein
MINFTSWSKRDQEDMSGYLFHELIHFFLLDVIQNHSFIHFQPTTFCALVFSLFNVGWILVTTMGRYATLR